LGEGGVLVFSMKKKLFGLLIFASAGVLFQTALANDAQIRAARSNGQPEASVSLQENNQPAAANSQAQYFPSQPSHLQKATELIGMDVRNQQEEKIGTISDVIVDFQSGQAPFAVLSSGGFFGVGNRMLAIPIANFQQNAAQDQLVLNMDRERLKSAPTFDKNNWPNMDESQWRSQIYSFYGQPASQESSVTQATTQDEINEAAGAQSSGYYSYQSTHDRVWTSQAYGETPTGLSPDRRPRQGLGAEDLTRNEQKLNNPEGYARSDAFISESSGADRDHETTTTIDEHRTIRTSPGASSSLANSKTKRATDLIGMEVKNAQNERIGEIKDVVIDMSSGRVAYAVLDPAGISGMGDKLYAVPPGIFTRSGDDRWLVFNTDKEMLSKAPSFEKNNWPQTDNQQFTTEVYRYYHQRPYWQSSRQIQEPSGAEPKMQQRDSRDSSSEWQKGNSQQQDDQQQIQEPSGAAPATTPGGELNEPTPQTEPERNAEKPLSSQSNQVNGSAAKETAEIQSTPQYQQQTQVQEEPAGATAESTAPATSEDQAGSDSDRRMSQQLKSQLANDSALSTAASNVKVSAANGRITLRGTVASEQEKQSIAQKAQEIVGSSDKVDNQLKVSGSSTNP
jgi:sporulation protein YlmC with PRC-barrel domain/osmotically-inducible protein OsmY